MSFDLIRRHVQICTSTNDLARAWAMDQADPAPAGSLVTAERQTAGRGSRGRRWEAAANECALMSFVLYPCISAKEAWQLGFLAALAASDALRKQGLDVKLKWPNDILLEGKKVGGVLVETVLAAARSEHDETFVRTAIAGIGLNVGQISFDGTDYLFPPVSLRIAAGKQWTAEEVIGWVTHSLHDWESRYRQDGFLPVFDAWEQNLATGAVVRSGNLEAELLGITQEGSAKVRLNDGSFQEWAGLEPQGSTETL